MRTPSHVQAVVNGGGLFTFYFYDVEGEVELIIRGPDSSQRAGGKWPSFEEAYSAGCALTDSPTKTKQSKIQHKPGFKYLVVKPRSDNKWWVVTAKGNRFEDTGVRFDSQEEAKKEISELCDAYS